MNIPVCKVYTIKQYLTSVTGSLIGLIYLFAFAAWYTQQQEAPKPKMLVNCRPIFI